jgi:hypothetical protein
MYLVDFLTSTPPGDEEQIHGLFAKHYSSSPSAPPLKVSEPDIKIYCANDKCQGARFFKATSTATVKFTSFKKYEDVYLDYECRNCGVSKKTFALRVVQADPSGNDGTATKFGEVPSYGPPVPSKVISIIGPDRDLFLRGRRAENQGLGIGAFAYYRRVVENQKGRLIEKIAEVAKKVGASPEALNAFKRAAKESQFSKAVEDVKLAIPQVLLIDGHNPLTLLHSALSEGLHAGTDEECLEMATSIRVVLTALSERISIALEDEAELKQALSALMRRETSP